MKYLIAFLTTLTLLTGLALAQETPNSTTEGSQTQTGQASPVTTPEVTAPTRKQFAVGMRSVYPAPIVGVSIQADLGQGLGAELTLAPLDILSGYSLKGSYAFVQEQGYQVNAFAVATIAHTWATDVSPWYGSVGAGVGFDYAPAFLFGFSKDANQPFWQTLEFGLTTNSPWGGATFMFGSGLQVRF